jgi:glycosyltransferase involved in cell wall biosynthesis
MIEMNTKKICFLVGSVAISGGTYVIFQHAFYLQEHGFEVTLAVQEPFTPQTLAWHDHACKLRCLPLDIAKSEHFDFVIATWWKTALELHNFNAPRFGYFVQSVESRFYPLFEAPLRTLADSTYQLPIAYVTEATWIRDYLKTNYGHDITLVRNGIRKDVYQRSGPIIAPRERNRQPRVLIEGHFGVSFKNTALGVRLAREAGAKDIWLLTGAPIKWVPRISRVFSRVPMNMTPEIYRSCDILVKLSTVEGMFGPPLEIFHCGGTAIVFNVTGHDEYIDDGHNAYVVPRGDMDGVVTALRRLLNDRAELARLQAGALQTAEAWVSWDESSSAFRNWVDGSLDGPAVDRATLAKLCDKAFSEYVRDEQQRLANSRHVARHRLSTLVSRFPPKLLRTVKQFEAAWEVLFGAREVR